MRAEKFIAPRPVWENFILWVFAVSWKPMATSEGKAHLIRRGAPTAFWLNWGRTHTFNLEAFVDTDEAVVVLAYLEACARHQIESYTGRTAALAASCRPELGSEKIRFWAYLNHSDIPKHLRENCEARLYGKMEPVPL